jgi:hypothetical protein
MGRYDTLSNEELREIITYKRLSHLRTRSRIKELKRQLDEARKERETLELECRHLKALRRWRWRTGRKDGDPIGALIGVVDRMTNTDQAWRLLSIDQPELDDGNQATITLRPPKGGRVRLTFNGVVVLDGNGYTPVSYHQGINRGITSVWTESGEERQRILCLYMDYTEKRSDAVARIYGDITAVEELAA